ncbi:MAG: type I-E CRISPR-associated protein Cse2/CasB [Micropruina sp.]|nr:type I-E CRISPR-associated protein Cse2/CasB [Micropruina sp.]
MAVAQLAQLRRCSLDDPADSPEIWGLTLGELPNDLVGRGDQPSRGESAVHASIVLFALHQQSQAKPMHRSGVGFGQAVRVLAQARGGEKGPDKSTIQRFQQVGLASTSAGRNTQLRSLVSLFRTDEIPLDYGLLAADLYRLSDPLQATSVLLQWGRDLHSNPKSAQSGEEE